VRLLFCGPAAGDQPQVLLRKRAPQVREALVSSLLLSSPPTPGEKQAGPGRAGPASIAGAVKPDLACTACRGGAAGAVPCLANRTGQNRPSLDAAAASDCCSSSSSRNPNRLRSSTTTNTTANTTAQLSTVADRSSVSCSFVGRRQHPPISPARARSALRTVSSTPRGLRACPSLPIALMLRAVCLPVCRLLPPPPYRPPAPLAPADA
jgi:hypothetical protein